MPSGTPNKDVNKRRRPNKTTWLKNATKSLGMIGVDYLSDIMPGTMDIVTGVGRSARDATNIIRSANTNGQRLTTTLQNNRYVKLAGTSIKNALNDIKTGNFDNQDRMLNSFGGDNSGMSFGDFDSDTDTGASIVDTGLSENAVATLAEVSTKNAEAMIKSTQAAMNAHVATTAATMVQTQEIGNLISSKLDETNRNLAAIVEFNKSNFTKFMEATTAYMEKTGKVLTASQESNPTTSNKKLTALDVFSNKNGGINSSTYIDYVKQQSKKYLGESQLGSLASMVDSFGDAFAANPLPFVAKFAIDSAVPEMMKTTMESLDEAFSGALVTMMKRMTDSFKNDTDSGIFGIAKRFIGNSLGFDLNKKNEIDLSNKITADAATFDGFTYNSINQVIPKYLRESNAYLKAIAEEITGRKNIENEAQYFDNSKGKYVTIGDYRKNFYKDVRDRTANSVLETQFGEAIRKGGMAEGVNSEEYDDMMRELFYQLSTKGAPELNGNWKSAFEDIIGNLNGSDKTKAYLQNAVENTVEKRRGGASMTAGVLAGNAARARYLNEIEKNPSAYDLYSIAPDTENFNKSYAQVLYGETDETRAQRKMMVHGSIMDKLANINFLLERGINVRVTGKKAYRLEDGGIRPSRIGIESVSRVPDEDPKASGNDKDRPLTLNDLDKIAKATDEAQRADVEDDTYDDDLKGFVGKFRKKGNALRSGIYDIISGEYQRGLHQIGDIFDPEGKLRGYVNNKYMQEGSTLGNLKNKVNNVKNMKMSDVRNSIVDKLFGKRESFTFSAEDAGLLGEGMPQTVHYRKGGGILSWFKEGMLGLQESLFGVKINPDLPIEAQRKQMKDQYDEKSKAFVNAAYDKIPDSVKANMKYVSNNAGRAAAGGIAGFMLGGPIGAAIGSAAGLATKSDMVQEFVYGKVGDDGKRSGGMKDKIVGAWHNFALEHHLGEKDKDGKVKVSSRSKMAASAASVGFLASLFTPIGPIGGTLAGLGVGLAAGEGKFHDFLFGKKDDNGKKVHGEGLIGSIGNIIETHWLKPLKNTIGDFVEDTKDVIQHKILGTIEVAFDPISKLLGNMVGGVIDNFKYKMEVVADNVTSIVKNGTSNIMTFLLRPAEVIGRRLLKTKLGGFVAGGVKKVASVLNPMNIVRGAGALADKANRNQSKKRYLAELEREKKRNPDRADEIDAQINAIKSGDEEAVNDAEHKFYQSDYKERKAENDAYYENKQFDKKKARAERDKQDKVSKFISDMTDGRFSEATAENLEIARRNFEQRSSNFHRSYRGWKRGKVDFDDMNATIEAMGNSQDTDSAESQEFIKENTDRIGDTTEEIRDVLERIANDIQKIDDKNQENRETRYKYDNDYQKYKEAMDTGKEKFMTEDEFNRLGMDSDEDYHKRRVLNKLEKKYNKKERKSERKDDKKTARVERHKKIDEFEDKVNDVKNRAVGNVRDALRNFSGYAKGTTSASPGFHVVGEEGPEIVHMKGGEQVENGSRAIPVQITGFVGKALENFIGFVNKHPIATAITASTNILPTYSMGSFNSKTDKSEDIKKAVDGKGSITSAMVEGDQYDDQDKSGSNSENKKDDKDDETKSAIEKVKEFFKGGFVTGIINGLKGLAGGLSLFAGGAAAGAGLLGLKKVVDVLNGTDKESSASNANTAEVDKNGVPVLDEEGNVKQKDATEEDKNASVLDRVTNFLAPNRTKIDTETGKAKTEHVVTNKSLDKARAYTMGSAFALTKAAPTLIKKGIELAPNAPIAKAITTGTNAAATIVSTFRTSGVKLINQIGDKIMGFLIEHGHEKAAEGVMDVLDKVLPSITDDAIKANSGAISKFFSGLAEKANVIGWAIELGSIGISGINGATSAGHLFDVDMSDENLNSYMKSVMVMISTIVGCFKGSTLGAFIDLISLILGTDFVKILANKLLDLILSDDQEKALDNAQENFKLDYEEYSKKEYEAYKKNAEANNQEAITFEQFKNDDKISTSFDEYNDDQNSGIVTKGLNAIKNVFTTKSKDDIKNAAVDNTAKVYSSSSLMSKNNNGASTGATSSYAASSGMGGKGGVPYYSQNDPRWRNAGYGEGSSGTMGTDGCGPTAFAMAASGAGKNINPMQAASFMQNNGYRDNTGTNAKGMSAAAHAAGLSSDEESNPSSSFVSSELSKGKPVVLLGRSGGYGDSAFTKSGHYVVATGTDKNGNVMINDPRGRRFSGKYKLNDVLGESSKAWAMGGKGPTMAELNKTGYDKQNAANATATQSTGTGVTANDVVKIASNEVGYLEKSSADGLDNKTGNAGDKNYTKYERDAFGSNGNFWCAIFVSWVFLQAANGNRATAGAVLRGSLSKSANALMTNFSSAKALIDRNTDKPMPGDIVFFHNTGGSNAHAGANHVGIIVSVNGNQIGTVEGNTYSKKYDSNGGCVAEKSYAINDSKIIGIGRPLYDNVSSFNGISSSATISSDSTGDVSTASSDASSSSSGGLSSILGIGSLIGNYVSKMTESSMNFLMGKGFKTTSTEETSSDGSAYVDGATDGSVSGSAESMDASSLSGSSNAEIIWNYYRKLGYSKAATSAILANLQHESGLNPNRRQNGGGPAAGIAQWENANTNTGRFAELSNYAGSRGTTWNDLATQLAFIDKELSGSQKAFFTKGKGLSDAGATPTTYEAWKNSDDIEMATRQFEGAFERADKPAIDTRIKYANAYYNEYANKDNSTTQTASANTAEGGSGGEDYDEFESMIDFSPRSHSNATVNSYSSSKTSGRKIRSNRQSESMGGFGNGVDLSTVIQYLQAIAENTGVSATKLDALKSLGTMASNTLNNTTNVIGGSSNSSSIPIGASQNQVKAEKIALGGY